MQLAVLGAAQLLILIFGGIIVYHASKGYAKRKSKAMLLLAIGFAIVTAGAVGAGMLFDFLGVELPTVEVVQASMQAIGFFAIAYSVVGTND